MPVKYTPPIVIKPTGWETIAFGTPSASFDITGLNLDEDYFYKLIIFYDSPVETKLQMRFNGDTGPNYSRLIHWFGRTDAVIEHSWSTWIAEDRFYLSHIDDYKGFYEIFITGRFNQPKSVIANGNVFTSESEWFREEFSGYWDIPAATLTTINVILPSGSGIYYYLLKPLKP